MQRLLTGDTHAPFWAGPVEVGEERGESSYASGGGVGRPAAQDGASGKGLVPALLPRPRASDTW